MRYPHYLQKDAKDCAPTCLKMVSKYYGKEFSLPFLREKCYTQRTGTSILGLSDGAMAIGFQAVGIKLTWEQLCAAPVPSIIHWKQNHFVVVYEINKNKVTVGDPAYGILKYDKTVFLNCWLFSDGESEDACGTALLLDPLPRLYETVDDLGESKPAFSRFFNYIKPYKKYIFRLLLAIIVGSGLSLIFPFLTQSIVDVGIGNSDLNFIILILVAQVVLTFGQTVNNFIRSWLMLHITTKMGISLISDFLGKLMRLPIAFFDTKMTGDIMQRIGDFSRIQSFLTGSLLSMFMALISLLVYGSIMAAYNAIILIVFLIGSAFYVLWILLFMKRRRKLDYMRFQEASVEQSNMVQLIMAMQEIKLNNCETNKRWEWERIQAKLYEISIKGLSLEQIQRIGAVFIDQIKTLIISFLSAKAVITGDLTFGMMMAIQYVIGQLNTPISQFIGFMQATQDARISLERLNEIQDKDDEEPVEENKIQDIPSDCDLILENVSFQYSGPRSPKVIDDVTLRIEANKITAVVGMSGSGKTTLLKLLLGFYTPSSGKLLLGDIPLRRYSDRKWRRQCGVVMQDGYIFYDTIAGNVGIVDDKPDMKRVRESMHIACIEDFVNSLPMGLNTKIGSDGQGLSTGQKQRLLIARAIYKNAKYVMLDEATNSLDANNELAIMTNLDRFFRNRTVIIVAHRLSTVKNADKIIVLKKGKVVEEGSHKELIALNGHYYSLIKNQLELGD